MYKTLADIFCIKNGSSKSLQTRCKQGINILLNRQLISGFQLLGRILKTTELM